MFTHISRICQPLVKFHWRQLSSAAVALPPHKEGKIKVKDVELYVCETVEHGQNAMPIFFLPGAFGCAELDFKPIMHEFDRKKYKWICYDPPGYGKSRPPNRIFSPPKFQSSCNVSDAEYIIEIMKIMGHPKYFLLAWSGASISGIVVAAQQPEKTAGLITWGGYLDIGPEDLKLLIKLRSIGLAGCKEPRKSQLVEMYGEDLLLKMWTEWLTESIDMSSSEGFKVGGTFRKVTSSVKCPTLVIQGLQDAIISFPMAKSLRKSIKDSRLCVIEDGTHGLHLNTTQEFVENVERFVDKCTSDSK